jgi:hypothetical protein
LLLFLIRLSNHFRPSYCCCFESAKGSSDEAVRVRLA